MMAHPWHHALMSARRFGGTPDDYLAVHHWMDYTKSHIADCRHRLFLHNAWGIYVAERILGTTLVRATDGKELPLRPTLEDHVKQDFGKIPTLAYCLDQLAPEPLERDVTIYDQCCASTSRWGGIWTDYQTIHQFLDWPREQLADGRFRRIFHNTWGVYMATQAFGHAFTRPSDGEILPVQTIAEQHIMLEYDAIPTLESCLEGIRLQRWMCVLAMPASVAAKLSGGDALSMIGDLKGQSRAKHADD
ncbi:MAG TPA: hypothetical protein VKB76_19370 [Ktedonobacterales bacterium]|nr:hypothetical protein [Ktedonobacterales bacterium]